MKRTAIGAVVGLAAWFGSALAAEAQVIQPTGPLSLTSGQQSCDYTATVYLPTPCNFQVKIWVYRGVNLLYSSTTIVSNPNTNYYNFDKFIDCSTWNLQSGQGIKFTATLTVSMRNYNASDLNVTVSGTRPSSKVTAAQKQGTLAVAAIDKDRRKE